MEKYIGKCLDSLLIPEIDQVEVLVVNDGSKDRSSEIAHSYANRFPNSIRVIDKENGNYGSCINVVLPQCTGRYVKILDADDTFDTTAFSEFVRLLSRMDDDVIITNYITVDETGRKLAATKFNKSTITNKTERIKSHQTGEFNNWVQMHRLSYNKRIFERFNYIQTEGISYTDAQWATIPLAYCETVRFIDLGVYKYLTGREGQTMSTEQLNKNLSHFFIYLKDLIQYYLTFSGTDFSRELFKKHISLLHRLAYAKALKANTRESIQILAEYDTYLKSISSDIYKAIVTGLHQRFIQPEILSDFRKKGYPIDYKLPLFLNLYLSIRARLLNK